MDAHLKGSGKSRRNFLKATASGAAGLMVVGSSAKRLFANTAASPWPATGYLQINPDIDNCRVVFINDPKMLLTTGKYDFRDWNTAGINDALVKTNIDKMACALARKADPADAWKTIFRKPQNKTWDQVKVAIKVNAVGGFSPNVPSVSKLCEALNGVGVPYGNITVFDAGNATGNGCVDKYTQFQTASRIPAGVHIAARGADTQVAIATETQPIQNVVLESDILITCAVNKGHDQKDKFGGLTMTLKNHTGTIKYGCATDLPMLLNYHKSEWILGTPSATVPTRQQLAFVDATWAGYPGSWGGDVKDGAVQSTLVMGTFPGAVDYLTAVKVRAQLYPNTDANNCNIGLINQFLTGFGYTDDERTALETMDANKDTKGRGFVDAALWKNQTGIETGRLSQTAVTRVSVVVDGREVRLDLAAGDAISSATVFSIAGKKIRSLDVPWLTNGATRLSWDGNDAKGRGVKSGTYIVKVSGRNSEAAAKVTIKK